MKTTKQLRAKILVFAGALLGLFFYYVYGLFLSKIKFLLFSQADTGNPNLIVAQNLGPVDYWLDAGLLAFFIVTGIYILNKDNLDASEKLRDIAFMKSSLIGFILYMPVTIIAYVSGFELSYRTTLAVGYALIVIVYFIIRNRNGSSNAVKHSHI
ncbi:hypothetical protein [Methanococcoides sp. LMO-2]|uniref:DUF2178 domain-containing protein n=1 Tax=Methanococcoides cohabitans TaxID=3136559 RepID=A0ABU9KUM8_9EURY